MIPAAIAISAVVSSAATYAYTSRPYSPEDEDSGSRQSENKNEDIQDEQFPADAESIGADLDKDTNEYEDLTRTQVMARRDEVFDDLLVKIKEAKTELNHVNEPNDRSGVTKRDQLLIGIQTGVMLKPVNKVERTRSPVDSHDKIMGELLNQVELRHVEINTHEKLRERTEWELAMSEIRRGKTLRKIDEVEEEEEDIVSSPIDQLHFQITSRRGAICSSDGSESESESESTSESDSDDSSSTGLSSSVTSTSTVSTSSPSYSILNSSSKTNFSNLSSFPPSYSSSSLTSSSSLSSSSQELDDQELDEVSDEDKKTVFDLLDELVAEDNEPVDEIDMLLRELEGLNLREQYQYEIPIIDDLDDLYDQLIKDQELCHSYLEDSDSEVIDLDEESLLTLSSNSKHSYIIDQCLAPVKSSSYDSDSYSSSYDSDSYSSSYDSNSYSSSYDSDSYSSSYDSDSYSSSYDSDDEGLFNGAELVYYELAENPPSSPVFPDRPKPLRYEDFKNIKFDLDALDLFCDPKHKILTVPKPIKFQSKNIYDVLLDELSDDLNRVYSEL